MKRGKRVACVLFATLVMSGLAWSPIETQAGASEIILDAASLEGNNWHKGDETVQVEDGTLVFSEEGTEDARMISKIVAQNEAACDYVAQLSANITFSKLPKGQSFIVAFGLSGIESYSGESGNVEVCFTNQNGIHVGVVAYDSNGERVTVAKSKNAGMSMNRTAEIQILVETNKTIKVLVGGRNVCSGNLPISAEGRIGFLQTGGVATKISNLEATCYQYSRPGNADVYEDFEKEDINTSLLTAKSLVQYDMSASGQMIEEYDGNNVLMMRNVMHTYVGTALPYSNFELTFDVPYINVDKIYDDEGMLQGVKNKDFVVCFGAEQSDTTTYSGWETAAESIVFSDGLVYSHNYPEENKGTLTKNPFTEGKPFSVKVSMVDGLVKVGIKWLDETKYQTVLTYKRRTGTPDGYVQVWTTKTGNFAIDNFAIKNLDDNPNLIETQFTTGWEKPEDFVYEPAEYAYAATDEQASQNEVLGWYLMIPAIATVGIVSIVITFVVTRKSKRRDTTHEN